MIVVTGATGTVGRQVVKQLVASGAPVRALVRDPNRRDGLGASIGRVRADLADAASLDAALAGAEKLFLLAVGPELAQLETNAIAAAERAGVRHIVELSALGADIEPGITLGRWHRQAERRLMASGIAWTILRPAAFMSNSLDWADTIKTQDAVYHAAGDGKMAAIHPADIAAVAVLALTTRGHEGQAYTLTGPEALSVTDQVERIAAALRRPVRAVAIAENVARAAMSQAGVPESMIDPLLELTALVRAGHANLVTATIQELLGRRARSFDEWLRDNLTAFQ
jgi:uncharacterized protein YbjT (DUF2867 family)